MSKVICILLDVHHTSIAPQSSQNPSSSVSVSRNGHVRAAAGGRSLGPASLAYFQPTPESLISPHSRSSVPALIADDSSRLSHPNDDNY